MIVKTSSSDRAQNIPVSSIRKLYPYALDAKEKGVNILHLNIGQPDVRSPKVLLAALQKETMNYIPYAASPGIPEFRQALVKYYDSIGFILPMNSIIGTIGGSEAILLAMYATCDRDNEIIVFEPFYSSYVSAAHLCAIKLTSVPTELSTGFHLPKASDIEKAITANTKAILFSNPCNPTGTVYTQEEIEMLVDIAVRNDLFIISDEVYREFIYIDRKHTSLLSYIDKYPDNIIVLDSLSKRYNICGTRLGMFVTCNPALLASANAFISYRLSGGYLDQLIGSRIMAVPQSYYDATLNEYRSRRDILCKGLRTISGIEMYEPEGAFYMMIKLPVDDAERFCIWLLESFRDNNETVMLAPGSGFYLDAAEGKQQVRVAYVLEKEKLQRAVQLLKIALEKYPH